MDMNADGLVNGDEAELFVDAVLVGPDEPGGEWNGTGSWHGKSSQDGDGSGLHCSIVG